MGKSLERIDALTGLRGVAAWMVVLYHFSAINKDLAVDFGPATNFIGRGAFGVDVFFVLSGLVIAYVYLDSFSERFSLGVYARYLWLRICRLYPVHLFMLFVMMGMYWIAKTKFGYTPGGGDGAFSFASIVANLFMVHEWLSSKNAIAGYWPIRDIIASFGPFGSPNGPSWTISCEFFAYSILFPFFAVWWRRVPMWGQVVGLVLWLGLMFVCAASLRDNMIKITLLFPLGIFIFQLHRSIEGWPQQRAPAERNARDPRNALGFAAAAVIAGLLSLPDFMPVHHACAVAATGILLFALLSPSDWFARVLSRPWLLYFGEISYSLYMVHWCVWSLRIGIIKAFPSVLQFPGLIVFVGMLLSWVSADLLYRWVEKPGRNWLRGLAHQPEAR